MNNFEKIKQMGVNEFARVLHDANDKVCFANCEKNTGNRFQCPHKNPTEENCIQCMVEWLESEVQGE